MLDILATISSLTAAMRPSRSKTGPAKLKIEPQLGCKPTSFAGFWLGLRVADLNVTLRAGS